MAEALKASDIEQTRIILGLLEYVERGGQQSQRRLASELGVALGLANAYLKRCIKKGQVKVSQAPARRYAYMIFQAAIAKFGPERVLAPALLGVQPTNSRGTA